MSKTYRPEKSDLPKPRNNVAKGMIESGTGKGKFFQDRRNKRSKEKNWMREDWD